MRRIVFYVFVFLLALTPGTAQAADCQFILGFKTLRDLIGHEIVGDCLESEYWNEIGDSNQRTTGGLMAWRKADNWTAFTDGYRTWINGPNGLVMRLNTTRFDWEADYAEIVLGIKPTPTPVPYTPPTPPPALPWPGVSTVPVGTPHRFTHDNGEWKETWEITVLEVVRGQALADRISKSTGLGASVYRAPPPGQEDIALKLQVTMVGNSRLGANGGGLTYATCVWRVGWRCLDYAHLDSIRLVMENGEEGDVFSFADLALGEVLDTDFVYTGESTTGWKSWRIWQDAKAVLIVKMDRDQESMPEYSAVFAL